MLPVATGTGSSAVIMSGATYAVKVTVADTVGNKETYSYPLTIIDAFTDTTLADNMMADFNEDEYIRNLVDVSQMPVLNKAITAEKQDTKGKALKLTLDGENGTVNVYGLKSVNIEETFAFYLRVFVEDGVTAFYVNSTTENVAVRAYNQGDFAVGEWIVLEMKATSFKGVTAIDSLGFSIMGASGKSVYIDEITYYGRSVDTNLDHNVLLDFDEKDIYGNWQLTTKWSNGQDKATTDANVQLEILEAGNSELPAGTNGGALKISTSAKLSGVHTWFFQDYVTVADIDGIAIRVYLSSEMIRKTRYVYIGITDYSPRELATLWWSNALNSPSVWKEGWNECVISSDWLKEHSINVVHGLLICTGGDDWNDVTNAEMFVDEIRVMPHTYVDTDLNSWTKLASYDKQEYVDSSTDFAPAVTSEANATVSIESYDSTTSLKIVTSAANGKVKLNFGPNNIAHVGGDRGLQVKYYSDKNNLLRLYGYGLQGGNSLVVEEFEINMTRGWHTYDLTEATGYYNTESDIYYFIAELRDAGTVYIDEISVLDSVQLPALKNGEVLWSAHDEYAAYALTDDTTFLRKGNYKYTYETLSSEGQGVNSAISVTALDSSGAKRTGIVSIRLNRRVQSDIGVLAVELYLHSGVEGIYFKNCNLENFDKGQKYASIQTNAVNIMYLPIADWGAFDELMIHFDIAANTTDVMKIARVSFINDFSSFTEHNITVIGGNANLQKAKIGTKVDLTVRQLSTVDKIEKFEYWTVNGVKITGNSFYMPDQDVQVEAKIKVVYADDYSEKMTQGTMWVDNGPATISVVSKEEYPGLTGNVAVKIDGGWRSVNLDVGKDVDITAGKMLKLKIYWPSGTRVVYVGKANAATDADIKNLAIDSAHEPYILLEPGEGWKEVYIPMTIFGNAGEKISAFMIATSDWFVFDEYEFVTPTAHTITVTGGTADKSSAKVNEKVTLTVTDSAVPSGKSFVGWKVNGKDISGNEFVMPDEDVTVIAIYAIDELTIPEGAYMLNDFSTGAVGTDWNGYGNGESQHGWLAEYDGRAGVEYIELTADNSNGVVRDVTPAYNLDQYNKVTLRVKAVSDCFTEMCIFTGTSPAAGNNGSDAKWIHANNSSELSAMDGWIEITLDISCLKTNNSDNNNANICIFVSNASKNKGIALYIDQIYLWNDSGTISG